MGNVNEGHERDEALSSSSDSAADLSECTSSLSYEERDDDGRSGVDLLDGTGDMSVLSDILSLNDSLGEIAAESTRVELAIDLDHSQYREIGVDTTTMVDGPGMTSLTSNLSLPISESIIPSSFDLLREGSPFTDADEVFHTPDLSAESKEETGAAHAKQIVMDTSDSLAPLSSLVGDKCELLETEGHYRSCIDDVLPDAASAAQPSKVERDPQQVGEATLEASTPPINDGEFSVEQAFGSPHMPSALPVHDSILEDREPLPSNDAGSNEVETINALNDAANEIIAKFKNADFVLTSTTASASPLMARATECDKCGHALNNMKWSQSRLDQSELRPIGDKFDEQALEEAMCVSTEEGIVSPAMEQTTNDILSEALHVVAAGTSERSLEFPASFSDALGEMDDNLSEKISSLAVSSSVAVTGPAELAHSAESRRNELECEPPLPLASLASREGRKNDQESNASSRDPDTFRHLTIESTVGTKNPGLSPLLHSLGVGAFVNDSPTVSTSTLLLSATACNVTAVESNVDNGIAAPLEKAVPLPILSVVSDELLMERSGTNDEETAMTKLPVIPLSSPRVSPATTISTTDNESAVREESCLSAKKDEQRVKAPEAPRHTPDRPNWAIAPVESASASKPPAKSERRKPAGRRGRKSGDVVSKDALPKPSTSSVKRSPVATSTVTLQVPANPSGDTKVSMSKSSVTKVPEAKSVETKAPAANSADIKVPEVKKAPKPILRLPDIGTYEKSETKPARAKPAVSFEFVPSSKTTTEKHSAPAKQATSSTKADSGSGPRSGSIATALQPAGPALASFKSTNSVEPTPARRGRSMSISAAQNSALPPNQRPASVVSSWRSGTALPVIPEGTTRIKQSDDGRKSLPVVQPGVATVDVSAKDKIAAILAESCQSNVFKFETSKAQGVSSATPSSSLRPSSITVPKPDVALKPGKAQSPESPLADGFQANEHPLLAWRQGVTQGSPPTTVLNSFGVNVTVRKPEDKDPKKDVIVSNSKGKAKAAKVKSKVKTPQPPQQGPATTVHVGHDDLSLHVQERGEPVKVNLPQTATPPEPLRYQTPPRTARPAFFSDVGGPTPITPSPLPATTHQHNAAFQRLGAAFMAHPSKPEYAANRDLYPQMFMPQRPEGISAQAQHSSRVDHPPQLHHHEFVPRGHTASNLTGHSHIPASSIPIRSVDSGIGHPGPRLVQVPAASHQSFATKALNSVPRQGQADHPFFDGLNSFDGRDQSRDFSLYQQQLYQQHQAEIARQSQGLRQRAPEPSLVQSRVNVDHPFRELWNGSRPADEQDVPIYQTSRPSAPPPNFAPRPHGTPPLAGQQRVGTAFNIPNHQFPPYN